MTGRVRYWILRNRQPVSTDDVGEFGRFAESKERVVRQSELGPVLISTVFTINVAFGLAPPPLFETMIISDGIFDRYDTCETWEQAETMHESALSKVRANLMRADAALAAIVER